MPNVFGNPVHHRWFDIWAGQWKWAPHNVFGRNTQAFDWGIRSYHVGRQLRWHRLLGTALPFRLVEFTARPSAAPPASDGVDNADPGRDRAAIRFGYAPLPTVVCLTGLARNPHGL